MSEEFRILYAEDNNLDADLTRAHFLDCAPQYVIETVETGQACLERILDPGFDLLLLDHHLPDMEGLEVLRTLIHANVALPVVLVTGSGDEDLVVRALRLGAANYVAKRGTYLDTLPDLLREVIREYRLRLSQSRIPVASRRVLYVEHYEMDIDLTLRHFAENAPQFELEVIRSCTEALTRLGQTPSYDAVLIDLRMPDQSGLDFVREAKRFGLALPPFIMVSGKGDEATAIASLALGAVDYITKRDGYLQQLPYTIDRAIAYDRLNRANAQLQEELLERSRAEAERGKLEEQLRASQKLEAIGSLAGGVAHDFNNLLSVILSYTVLAIEDLPADNPTRTDLFEVKQAADRAAALTRQLLAFSRKQLLQPVLLDLNQIVTGVEKMLQRLLGEDIKIVHALAPDLGLTLADPGQIEQVLMNLVVNARDAMIGGGELTIETHNVSVDEEYADQHVSVKPGEYIQLVVSDTGCGMDSQTQARIFEPFFTTKGKNKGTGLGLSTVYGIVKQSGGNIWVYSELNRGTTFKVYLLRDLSGTKATDITPSIVPTSATGTETVLVVEDEEALRKVAVRALQAAGYTVLAAACGEEALLASSQHAGHIHLLLTDIIMPRMSGRTLAQEIAKARPTLVVVYMSGYTDSVIAHHGVLEVGTHFLPKPFTSSNLTRKIREVLDIGLAKASIGHDADTLTDANE